MSFVNYEHVSMAFIYFLEHIFLQKIDVSVRNYLETVSVVLSCNCSCIIVNMEKHVCRYYVGEIFFYFSDIVIILHT